MSGIDRIVEADATRGDVLVEDPYSGLASELLERLGSGRIPASHSEKDEAGAILDFDMHRRRARGVSLAVNKWAPIKDSNRSSLGKRPQYDVTNTSIAFDRQGVLEAMSVSRLERSREADSPKDRKHDVVDISFYNGKIGYAVYRDLMQSRRTKIDVNVAESVAIEMLEMALEATAKFTAEIPEGTDQKLVAAIAMAALNGSISQEK